MSRTQAMLLVLLGGSFMSTVGLYMKLLEQAHAFQILFFRSLSLSVIVALVCCLRRGVGPIALLRSLDRSDLWMGITLSIAFTFYIFAMLNTSVASTLFILTASPFLAAIIGWLWIGERPKSVTWVAMIFASIGIGLMVQAGLSLGQSFGNAMAFLAALFFALMLVIARRSGKDDVLGGTLVGGFCCILIGTVMMGLLGLSLSIDPRELSIILIMGAFGIGIGIAFVTWGTGYLPAAEVSLLVLIESVLGPLWPWIFLGQAMTTYEMLGGALVLMSVVVFALSSKEKNANPVEVGNL